MLQGFKEISARKTVIGVVLLVMSVVANAETKTSNVPGDVRLLLPDVVYSTVGVESNIYFDNIVLCVNRENYVFEVNCKKGKQQVERWTFVPTAKDVGTYDLVVKVLDGDNKIVARAKTSLRVIPANAGKGENISMLCIGDSLTQHSLYVQNLLELSGHLSSPLIKMVGTRQMMKKNPDNRHEGYGGWTARRFVTDAKKSPFLFRGKLDFKEYCRKNNGGKIPEFVTIFLGCNDIFHAVDANVDHMANDMFKYYDQLVEMVSKADKSIRIGLVLPIPPAATQDAFGANYGCLKTRWQYKRNQHRLVERMLKKYSHREKENIFVVPAYLNIDCVNGFPLRTAPANSRTKRTIERLNNGVHPSKVGFYQVGDSIYAWLKAMLVVDK